MSNYFEVTLPEFKQAKLDIWQNLDQNQLKSLIGCFEETEFIKSSGNSYELFSTLICKLLNMDPKSKKDQILIDKYFYLIKFCLQKEFTLVQISALLSLLIRTHRVACETAFGNLDQTFKYFKDALMCYAVHRPPFSLNLFEPSQIKQILDYFFDAYFKQFKFYKYVFSTGIKANLSFSYTNQPEPEPNEQNQELDYSLIRIESRLLNELTQIEENKEPESTEANNQIRQFVKDYLNQHLTLVKNDLLNEEIFTKIGDKKSSAQKRLKSSNSAKSSSNIKQKTK